MPAYFDHNATTPLLPAAREAWLRASDRHWHNPSSLYREAGLASQALETVRARLADLLGAEPERLVFTSGATEANNMLFAGLSRCLAPDACVAISAVEHPSVREAARSWLGRARVTEIPVDEHGRVTVGRLEDVIRRHRPALVSVMAANNESGVLQPWPELLTLCRSHGVRFHADASQWVGKMDSSRLGACDYVTVSGHKFGGAKGAGFLLLADEQESFPLLVGGPQEAGRRAGTENLPAVEAVAAALEHLAADLESVAVRQGSLRDEFIERMKALFPGLRVISEGAPRLWNTVLMVMPRHPNLKWLTRLSRLGLAISTGSACSSGREGSSVVVQALGADWDELRRVVRVSGGWQTGRDEWQELASGFEQAASGLDEEAAGRS
ncbi:MAG: Cysteine desulfurase IscS [Prosthecobacter sp.]|nr:Cysteine desulfurase IscS [Prosthecobacter sp.]